MNGSMSSREAWTIVVTVSAVVFFVLGMSINAFGLLIDPVARSFGVTGGAVSILATAFLFTKFGTAPIVGLLLDRVPTRWVLGAGAALASASYLWAGMAHSLAELAVAMAFAGAGVGASTIIPGIFIATKVMERRRGLAVGFVVSAASSGGVVSPFLLSYLISAYGWRATLQLVGGLILMVVPLILIVMRRLTLASTVLDVSGAAPSGMAVSDALRLPSFWAIIGIQALSMMGLLGAYVFFVPFALSMNYDVNISALMLGLMNAISALGCICAGYAVDRFGLRRVLIFVLLANAVTLALADPRLEPFPHAAVVLLVLGWGFVQGAPMQLTPLLLVRSVGLRRFGTLNGLLAFFAGVTQAQGPLLAGMIYDHTHSYVAVFRGSAAVVCLALVLAPIVRARFRETGGVDVEATSSAEPVPPPRQPV